MLDYVKEAPLICTWWCFKQNLRRVTRKSSRQGLASIAWWVTQEHLPTGFCSSTWPT